MAKKFFLPPTRTRVQERQDTLDDVVRRLKIRLGTFSNELRDSGANLEFSTERQIGRPWFSDEENLCVVNKNDGQHLRKLFFITASPEPQTRLEHSINYTLADRGNVVEMSGESLPEQVADYLANTQLNDAQRTAYENHHLVKSIHDALKRDGYSPEDFSTSAHQTGLFIGYKDQPLLMLDWESAIDRYTPHFLSTAHIFNYSSYHGNYRELTAIDPLQTIVKALERDAPKPVRALVAQGYEHLAPQRSA